MYSTIAAVPGSSATRWKRFVLAASSLVIGMTAWGSISVAKFPGSKHCYNDICHRVMTVGETQAAIGVVQLVKASHYDAPERDRYNPRLETSSGERFQADRADNAASPIFPDGTKLLVWNAATGMAAAIRINNAGPYFPGRDLDVSRALAERLGFAHAGVATLHITVIAAPSEEEARYRRGRNYPAMPGVLGQFGSLELARLASDDTVVAMLHSGDGLNAPASVAGWRRAVERVHRARSTVSTPVGVTQPPKVGMPVVPTASSVQRHATVDRTWTGRFYD